jgi:hypothetical protein
MFKDGMRVRFSDDYIDAVYTGNAADDEWTRQELLMARGTIISFDNINRLADVRWDGQTKIRRMAYGNIKQY